MKHCRSHIAQLAEFPVRDRVNRDRLFDDARIRNQEPGNIGPVLVDVYLAGARDDRSRHVGAAS